MQGAWTWGDCTVDRRGWGGVGAFPQPFPGTAGPLLNPVSFPACTVRPLVPWPPSLCPPGSVPTVASPLSLQEELVPLETTTAKEAGETGTKGGNVTAVSHPGLSL